VAEEAPQELRPTPEALPLLAHVAANLLNRVRREVREAAVFEVAPDELDGVEFGRVGRQPDDVTARMSGEPGAHEVVRVRPSAIPEEDEGAADVAGEMTKKAQHLRTPNVDPRMQCERERDLTAPGRDNERANARDFLVRTGADGDRRRGAARRPRPPQHGHHEKAGFIEANQVRAEAPKFFLPEPSRVGSTRARGGRRVPWLGAAVVAD